MHHTQIIFYAELMDAIFLGKTNFNFSLVDSHYSLLIGSENSLNFPNNSLSIN